MKRSHSQIWRDIQRTMRDLQREGRWHACRHEDSVTIGVPDVSYGLDGQNGWIELKSVPDWPIRGAIKIRDLTYHQVRWLEDRGQAGGSCWLLMSVRKDYVLMNHEGPRLLIKRGLERLEKIPAEWLVMKDRLDGDRFAEHLRQKRGETGWT